MEKSFMEYLKSAVSDLKELEKIKKHLNSQSKPICLMNRQVIEALHSILKLCASQNPLHAESLDIVLDCLHEMINNTYEKSTWNLFGYELGNIYVKILSTLERTTMFEVLFSKFLTNISIISKHNVEVWKSVSRQILNVFINKKLTFMYFSSVLKQYIEVLRNVDSFTLQNFAHQNLTLLKNFSMLIQRTGDFETQKSIIQVVFLHISNERKSLKEFFRGITPEVDETLSELNFLNFDNDSRLFLNVLNKSLGIERKVFSVNCMVLLLGECFVEPLEGEQTIWMDANQDTNNITIKCIDAQADSPIYVNMQIQDIVKVTLEHTTLQEKNCFCITIEVKSLNEMHSFVKSNEVKCIVEDKDNSQESVMVFVNFLDEIIKRDGTKKKKRRKRKVEKLPKLQQVSVCDLLNEQATNKNNKSTNFVGSPGTNFLMRGKLQDNSISSSSSKNSGLRYLLPDVLNPYGNIENYKIRNFEKQKNNSENLEEDQHKEEIIQVKNVHRDHETENHTLIKNEGTTQGENNPTVEVLETEQNEDFFVLSNDIFLKTEKITPNNDAKVQTLVLEAQENNDVEIEVVSPNSFVESLNKSLGISSQEVKNSFEELIETLEYGQDNNKNYHVLFRSPEKINELLGDEDLQSEKVRTVDKGMENIENIKPLKTKSKKIERKSISARNKVLTLRKDSELKLLDSESDDYFRVDVSKNKSLKKPSLPKINRNSYGKRKLKKDDEKHKNNGQMKPDVNNEVRNVKNKLEQDKTVKTYENPKRNHKKKEKYFKEQIVKPSLLDPNSETYQRWLMPTNSKRSNFWLEKLENLKKEKKKTENIFDFFDSDSDTLPQRGKKAGKKETYQRKKYERKKDKGENSKKRRQLPITHIKNILTSVDYNKLSLSSKTKETNKPEEEKTKVSPIHPQGSNIRDKENQETERNKSVKKDLPENKTSNYSMDKFPKNDLLLEETTEVPLNLSQDILGSFPHSYDNLIITTRSDDDCLAGINDFGIENLMLSFDNDKAEVNLENELHFSSGEDNIPPTAEKTKKRIRSDEDNSFVKKLPKKKIKAKRCKVVSLPSTLERRLKKLESTAKQETDDIIATVNKAISKFFNHIWKKEARKLSSYLKVSEEVCSALQEILDFDVRFKRIQRLIAYFEDGCSISKSSDIITDQFSKVRKSMEGLFMGCQTSSKKITPFSENLRDLIGSEIEKTIKNEFVTTRNRLNRYASFLDINYDI